MVYKGHVKNGAIVLDDSVALSEGAAVTVELNEEIHASDAPSAPCFADRYRPFIGALDSMPNDWSENHDKYLREVYGA